MKNLLYILCVFSFQFAFAQSELPEGFGDYRTIENIVEGHGYAKGLIPTQFETKTKLKELCLSTHNRHLLKDLEKGKDYEIGLEIVEIKPPYKSYKIKSPHFYENRNIGFHIVEEKWENVDSINPKWNIGDTILQYITIKPAYTKFIPFHINYRASYPIINDKNCLSIDPEMVIVWSYKYFKARKLQHQKVIHQVGDSYRLETLPDTVRYNYFEYQFDTTYHIIETLIPAEMDTFEVVHFYNNNIQKVVTTIDLTTYKISAYPKFTEWREILCPTYCGVGTRILEIQKALKNEGYDVKPDNIFNRQTKKALIQFQKNNGLPIGQLDVETLKALSVQ